MKGRVRGGQEEEKDEGEKEKEGKEEGGSGGTQLKVQFITAAWSRVARKEQFSTQLQSSCRMTYNMTEQTYRVKKMYYRGADAPKNLIVLGSRHFTLQFQLHL